MNEAKQLPSGVWDEAAKNYDSVINKNRYFNFVSEWISRCAPELSERGECRVLDLGCGTGLNVSLLRRENISVRADGVDVSQGMIESAREKGLYETLCRCNLEAPIPELSSESYDLVIAFGFLEFLSDAYVCLCECERVLKVGGILWATFKRFEAEDVGSPPRQMQARGVVVRGYSAAEIIHIMNLIGMRLMSLEPTIGYVTPQGFGCPYYVVQARKEPDNITSVKP